LTPSGKRERGSEREVIFPPHPAQRKKMFSIPRREGRKFLIFREGSGEKAL
jgi:hypothetical protein